jgi:hypothetical protein
MLGSCGIRRTESAGHSREWDAFPKKDCGLVDQTAGRSTLK